MRKIKLVAGVAGAFLLGAVAVNATTFVISGTPVEVYSKAEVDALLATVATLPISIANVTGLQAALDGKAAVAHAHAQSDVTNLTADLAARVVISPAAGNDIAAVFMGAQAECDAISPKNANTLYVCL